MSEGKPTVPQKEPSELEIKKNIIWHIIGAVFPLALLGAGTYVAGHVLGTDARQLILPTVGVVFGLPTIAFLAYNKNITPELTGTLLGTVIGYLFGKLV